MSSTAERAQGAIEEARPTLIELSELIHANPELAFEEHVSCGAVSAVLEAEGFKVTRSLADMPTAIEASYGSGELRLAFIAEYDALPSVGHACGHNLIAAAAV